MRTIKVKVAPFIAEINDGDLDSIKEQIIDEINNRVEYDELKFSFVDVEEEADPEEEED